MKLNSARPIMVTHFFILLLNLWQVLDVNGKVRLQRNSPTREGAIEIYHQSQQTWNPLCGDCWSNKSANVACRELGFSGGVRQSVSILEHGTGILTDSYYCPTGNEANLSSCQYRPCSPCTEVAGVLCAGAVRLVDVSLPDNIKLVSVFLEDVTYGFKWNFLCGECWTSRNAKTVCKQFGYSSGVTKLETSGEGYVWERHYYCTGSESELELCKLTNLLCPACQRFAAVQCAVDGSWSEWGSFGRCSVTCGEGYWVRKRSCDNPAPQYGGLACDGDDENLQPCTVRQCPGIWNESCSTDFDCAASLLCKESGTCGCMHETDVWDQAYLKCQSSLEFRAIYSQDKMDFASATEFCSLNMTGFLATPDYMSIMFIACMGTSNVIWLAENMTTANTNFGDNQMEVCWTGRVDQASEILMTEVSCREVQDFVCVVNRTHLSSDSNEPDEPACVGFISNQIKTNNDDIAIGTVVAVVAACAVVIIAATVTILVARNRYSKGKARGGSKPETLQVDYNNEAPIATIGGVPDTDHNSQSVNAPSVDIDDYGYGVLGKPSRPSVGMGDDDLYSHTKSEQPLDGEYDVFVKRKENLDESGIYDHTGNGMTQGEYDVFQGRKSSYVENDDSLYILDTNELP
ncbi:uncharacterized protein LOC117317415 [Pecten maximus]|uniref:uncharacterized protein LOC117317415 n=1 Tax=Pecten maximus TaxID=6579 RepID=UPI0014586FE1|nr:uncharacterized protein LOC117317415 [Pecten maximus]